VSGAIKRKAGTAPFRELSRHGPLPLGAAVWTGAGRLRFHGLIHVAGINLAWRASEFSIRQSVINAVELAVEHEVRSLAFPVIGAGSGGFDIEAACAVMLDGLAPIDHPALVVRVVRFVA
jgi:O-acetyl-ADP-ribose deacetylase